MWAFILWIAGREHYIFISFHFHAVFLHSHSNWFCIAVRYPLWVFVVFCRRLMCVLISFLQYFFCCPFCVQTVIVLALNSMFTSLYTSTSSDFAINLFTLHSTRCVRNTFAWQTDSTIVINLLYSFHFIWRRAMNVAKSHKNRCEKTQTHTRSHWQFCVSKNPILNKLHF